MSRPADPELRANLVEEALEYVCEHGVSDFSMRALASHLDVPASLLVYHFGSKDKLLMEIIKAGRRRQQALIKEIDERSGGSDSASVRVAWKTWSAPKWRPLLRLFFELYVLSLGDRKRFPGFLSDALGDWMKSLEPRGDAASRARATLFIAAFRGLFLDLCASGDRKRIDDAVELFASLLE